MGQASSLSSIRTGWKPVLRSILRQSLQPPLQRGDPPLLPHQRAPHGQAEQADCDHGPPGSRWRCDERCHQTHHRHAEHGNQPPRRTSPYPQLRGSSASVSATSSSSSATVGSGSVESLPAEPGRAGEQAGNRPGEDGTAFRRHDPGVQFNQCESQAAANRPGHCPAEPPDHAGQSRIRAARAGSRSAPQRASRCPHTNQPPPP